MIKIEEIDTWGFKHAIRGMRAKGYRKTKTGYETFISEHSKSISLGTYRTEEEAREVVIKYRLNRFKKSCGRIGLNAEDGVEYEKNYIVFPSGQILNLHGVEIIGAVGRDGYRHIIVNGKNKDVHRIIASVFIPNPNNYHCVNHKNGIKNDNRADNLEWCTHSDNTLHSFKNGLQKFIVNQYGKFKVSKYDNC